MKIIPLKVAPNQDVQVVLNDQLCRIVVYQTFYQMFMDLYVNEVLIIGGVICENKNRIVRSAYLGFYGDFAFLDTQGDDDPVYTGLGDRFFLAYLEPSEVAGAT